MYGRSISEDRATYVNPVYPKSFPDPFVLKHRGQYYGYCTGNASDGRVFGIITSRDLVTWHEVGGAMELLPDSPPFYWAPEVTYDNGKFYLYYSAGNETLMHLRVAVSDRPDGDFVDSGRVLTSAEFAIDAHVFVDTDGVRYMFYATDFLEHTHIGTGTVVDRMLDWYTLEGDPRPVTRAKFDWQVYDPQRREKGGVRWHTVEGPAVLKRKGRYFEMFSGGNWQNTTYGVSFAVSDSIDGHDEWEQYSDGETIFPIMRTLPGLVTGPGHNSVVRGPNNRELYCIYHSWSNEQRVAAIDRMDIAGDRIFVIGPTYSRQPMPHRPAVSDLFADEPLFGGASSTGQWRRTECGIQSSAAGSCERVYATEHHFLCEFTFNCIGWKNESSSFGYALGGNAGNSFEFSLKPGKRTGSVIVRTAEGESAEEFFLPLDFILSTEHLFRIEVNGDSVTTSIDTTAVSFDVNCPFSIHSLGLWSRSTEFEASALTITNGFEDLFENNETDRISDWEPCGSHSSPPQIISGELRIGSESECSVTKGNVSGRDFEFAANIRSTYDLPTDAEYGLQILDGKGESVARFGVNGGSEAFFLHEADSGDISSVKLAAIAPGAFRQLRFIRIGGRSTALLDDVEIGSLNSVAGTSLCAVYCRRTSIGIEMARMTII